MCVDMMWVCLGGPIFTFDLRVLRTYYMIWKFTRRTCAISLYTHNGIVAKGGLPQISRILKMKMKILYAVPHRSHFEHGHSLSLSRFLSLTLTHSLTGNPRVLICHLRVS